MLISPLWICITKFDSFVRLPGDGRSPDWLFLGFPFRKFPRWRRMNGGRRWGRLPLLHRLGVDGSGILVLLFDPRDFVVLAGLSRHRGRYLSHLYLRVKKSLMVRILRRSATFHHGAIAIEPRSIPFVICNPDRSPSRAVRVYDRGCSFAPAVRHAARFIGAAKSARAFKCNVMARTRQVANTWIGTVTRGHSDVISRCAWYGIKWVGVMMKRNKKCKITVLLPYIRSISYKIQRSTWYGSTHSIY